MRLLLWLYPRSWRARYQPEVEALLRCTRPTPTDVWDLLRGALDARLHPRRPGLRGLRGGANLIRHIALAATLVPIVAAGALVMAIALRHSPSRVGTVAGTVSALGLLAAFWKLRRRRRGPRRSDDDPYGGAGVPARPGPSAPPVLTAAGGGPSPGSGRRSDPE